MRLVASASGNSERYQNATARCPPCSKPAGASAHDSKPATSPSTSRAPATPAPPPTPPPIRDLRLYSLKAKAAGRIELLRSAPLLSIRVKNRRALGAGLIDARRQARLVARGGVPVQDALLHRLVDGRNRLRKRDLQ